MLPLFRMPLTKTDDDPRKRETFVTCPKCVGKNRRACDLCKGTGVVSKSEARLWKAAHAVRMR